MNCKQSPTSITAVLLLAMVGMGAVACGPRRVNVMFTPQQTLMAVGYSAERSGSILRANNDAQLYCERRKQTVKFIQQETVYEGYYKEDVTVVSRTAGRVAGALGSREGARAGRAMSSPTDYKTVFEFSCK